MAESGLVVGTSGNVSVRASDGEALITPSGLPYEDMKPEDIAVVDMGGNLMSGPLAPSVETPMHLGIYAAGPGVGSIVHTHARHSTILACMGFVKRREERKTAEKFASSLSIRGAGMDDPVSRLSGGNQQKVVLAKSLAREPSVLLLDEPTRGVDVGAKSEIYRLIDDLAGEGKAVLLISSELEEILSMSDRIVVMREGRMSGEFERGEADQEKIMAAATGAGAEVREERK